MTGHRPATSDDRLSALSAFLYQRIKDGGMSPIEVREHILSSFWFREMAQRSNELQEAQWRVHALLSEWKNPRYGYDQEYASDLEAVLQDTLDRHQRKA